MKKISFVIPCYRSSKTIEQVIKELEATMEEMTGYAWEYILVNDFSPDNTYQVIANLAEKNSKILGINLAKNFGQHAAIMAGLHYASGDIVVCLDDDGQTPAAEVDKLIEGLKADVDVVYARYANKKHSWFRNFGTTMNEFMARVLLGKPKDLYVSSYFAMRSFVRDEIIKYDKSYPYLIGLILRTTGRIKNVDIIHRERITGSSGYNFRKLLGLWMNGFTAFSITPLRISTIAGCILAFLGFVYGIITVIKHFFVVGAPLGYASMMSALLFIGGMILMMLGLTGEYIGRMYIGINNSPQYVIRETTAGDKKAF